MMALRLANFLKDKKGVVVIEAAFVIPLIIVILLCSHEIGSYMRVKERMERTSAGIADVLGSIPRVYGLEASSFKPDYANGFAPNAEDILKLAAVTAYPFSANVSVAYCENSASGITISTAGTTSNGLIQLAYESGNQITANFPATANSAAANVSINKDKFIITTEGGSNMTEKDLTGESVENARCSGIVEYSGGGLVYKDFDNTSPNASKTQPYVVVQAWTKYRGAFNPSRFLQIDFGDKGDNSNEAIVMFVHSAMILNGNSTNTFIPSVSTTP